MKDTNYAFCVARLRALENKLLTKQDISNLIDSKDYDSAFNFIVQKGYSSEATGIEELIRSEAEKLKTLLEESVPDKQELEILYLLNDYFNLKALVKCAVDSSDPSVYFVYPTTVLYQKTAKDLFCYLNEEYRTVAVNAYDIALKSRNGKYSDTIIDKASIDALANFSRKRKTGLAGEICAFLADTANIKIALRCAATGQDKSFVAEAIGECCKLSKEKLIESAIAGRDKLLDYLSDTFYKKAAEVYSLKPSDFEKWCDDEIIEKCRTSVYTSFGFDPVISYYYKKNLEIKTVRMILTALKSNTDKQTIRERVRKLYA